MPRRGPARTGVLAVAALGLLASGCGGDAEPTPDDLREALLPEFEDAQRAEDQTEAGTFSELQSVQGAAALREDVELDKPECLDAGHRWNQLEAVRDAASAVGVYGREGELITHVLVEADEDVRAEAMETRLPDECREYEATGADGTVSSYTATDIDTGDIGSDSYAFLVETTTEDANVAMYSIVYEGEGYLGMTTVLGTNADAEETLTEFASAALEHEQETL